MLQNVTPYFTPEDIDKGARWNSEIRAELSACDFGVIFLTPENQHSSWILFEAGALSKLDNSRVAPVLMGMEPADVSGPLAQLQLTTTSKTDVFQLIRSLNSSLGSLGLEGSTLDDLFDALWPRLKESLDRALAIPTGNPTPSRRPDRELLEEIVERLRSLEQLTVRTEPDWIDLTTFRNSRSKDVMDWSVTDLKLSKRTTSVLVQSGILTVRKLSQLATHQIESLPGSNSAVLAEIEGALAKYGIDILPF